MSDGTFFIVAIEMAQIDKMAVITFLEVWMRGFITLRYEKPNKFRLFVAFLPLFQQWLLLFEDNIAPLFLSNKVGYP